MAYSPEEIAGMGSKVLCVGTRLGPAADGIAGVDIDGIQAINKAIELGADPDPGGTWKVVDEDGFPTSIELTLALAQTTRNGVPAGNREHTLRGSVASGTMTGTVETTMFGSVARGDLELTKM